jgi:hypothetical protein
MIGDLIKYSQLKPGLLVKKPDEDFDVFSVVKNKAELLLKNIFTGDELYPEAVEYVVVGKERNENILVLVMHWGCREEFPMEELEELLKERSDKRKKTYVSFPDDGSDTFMGVFTSQPVTDSEAYYVYLKSHDLLFDGE